MLRTEPKLQKWDGDTPDVVAGDNLGIMLDRPPKH